MTKKKAIAVLMVLVLLLSVTPKRNVSAAECLSWRTEGITMLGCDSSDGCGFLWLQGTYKAMEHQYRTCYKDVGTDTYVETRNKIVSYDCCDKDK